VQDTAIPFCIKMPDCIFLEFNISVFWSIKSQSPKDSKSKFEKSKKQTSKPNRWMLYLLTSALAGGFKHPKSKGEISKIPKAKSQFVRLVYVLFFDYPTIRLSDYPIIQLFYYSIYREGSAWARQEGPHRQKKAKNRNAVERGKYLKSKYQNYKSQK